MSYREKSSRAGTWMLVGGAAFPLFVVVLELLTGWCADVFFDPIPTVWHVVAVLAVPAVNAALWHAAQGDSPPPRWLMAAGGAAIAISASYALLFLPLLPIALIGVIFFGIGLLPYAPLLALVVSVKLTRSLAWRTAHAWRAGVAGAAIGLVALILIDIPSAATHLALRWSAEDDVGADRGVALMRAVGDREMLLRLCYGDNGRATGLLSVLLSARGGSPFGGAPIASTDAARELYFRVTGTPFNAVEPPSDGRAGENARLWEFDAEQGGVTVGGRLAGLSLLSSRIDGSIAPRDNVAYLEWTAEFQNDSFQQREARMTLALPTGAVASRATLWVNGEPREASIGGRGEVRAAYRRVVVTERRDPLLVTTDGADRLLVQAFPIQPNASMKIRIGISAPLDIASDGARSLALPAIADRNFSIGRDLRHSIWIESDGGIGSKHAAFAAGRTSEGAARLRGAIDDAELARRPRILAGRIEASSTRAVTVPAGGRAPALDIVQRIARVPGERPAALTLLIDGSVGNRAAANALRSALDAIPNGLPVALAIAAEEPVRVAAARWSPPHRAAIERAIAEAEFVGGQDNVGALADSLGDAGGDDAVLLWVHGSQPVEFARSRARLEQLLERSTELPRLVRYQPVPGPEFAIAGNGWFEAARHRPASVDAAADLAAILGEVAGATPGWRVERREGAATEEQGSLHIARLWAAERIGAATDLRGAARDRAIGLARRLGIVTPLSGAVVLETDADYEANGLAVPDAADVPTVPEPGIWAMLLIVFVVLGWLLRRRPRREATAS